jgi:hypothetical protein
MLGKAAGTTRGKFSKMNILDELLEKTIELWVVYDEDNKPIAAVTTRVIPYDKFTALSIDWVGGQRMSEWIDLVIQTLTNYAKDKECSMMAGYGRKAWAKVLAKYGWEQDYIAYRMELKDE